MCVCVFTEFKTITLQTTSYSFILYAKKTTTGKPEKVLAELCVCWALAARLHSISIYWNWYLCVQTERMTHHARNGWCCECVVRTMLFNIYELNSYANDGTKGKLPKHTLTSWRWLETQNDNDNNEMRNVTMLRLKLRTTKRCLLKYWMQNVIITAEAIEFNCHPPSPKKLNA